MAPKILKHCTRPLTCFKVVDTIVTEMGYVRVTADGLVLEEVAPGMTPEQVQKCTQARWRISPSLKQMRLLRNWHLRKDLCLFENPLQPLLNSGV